MAVERMSVIVPTWMRANWLAKCLDALEKQKLAPSQVIVVGRPSDTAAYEVVSNRPETATFPIEWVAVHRPGHMAPVAAGLDRVTESLVACLDDDTEAAPDWLSRLVGVFEASDVACVGGRVMVDDFRGKVRRDAGRVRWYGRHIGNVGARDGNAPIEVDSVVECNWAWRTQLLRDLIFDPVLDVDDASMYGLDLCLQAKAKGFRVLYQPQAVVRHNVAPRESALLREDRPRRVRWSARNYTYIALKHLSPPRRLAFGLWWLFVGERAAYGVAKGLVDVWHRGPTIWPEVTASFAGKLEGFRIWRAQHL